MCWKEKKRKQTEQLNKTYQSIILYTVKSTIQKYWLWNDVTVLYPGCGSVYKNLHIC